VPLHVMVALMKQQILFSESRYILAVFGSSSMTLQIRLFMAGLLATGQISMESWVRLVECGSVTLDCHQRKAM